MLSEFPAQSTAKKWTYVQEDRVIAGLCETLVVVEAPLRSGPLFPLNCCGLWTEVYSHHHPRIEMDKAVCNCKGWRSLFGNRVGVSEPTIDGRSTENRPSVGRERGTAHKQLTELAWLVGSIRKRNGTCAVTDGLDRCDI